MNKDIETLREAVKLIETVFPTNAWRMPVIKELRSIADRMEQQSKAEPVGSVHKDTLAMLPTLRHVDGGSKIWPARKAKHDDAYILVYPHPPADARDAELLEALKKICSIEDRYTGGEWDEIEEARSIAKAAIAAKEGK